MKISPRGFSNRRFRRRRTKQADQRLIFVAIAFVSILCIVRLHLAMVAGILFGVAALAIWYLGASSRLREIHRWSTLTELYSLTPDDFERHVAQTYNALGYKTTVTPRIGDQGIDVIAIRGSDKIGIQCKRSNDRVSNDAVQEAYAGKAHYRCSEATVIALGGFTSSAKSLAGSTQVSLIDGSAYADLFHRAQSLLPHRSPWVVAPNRNAVLCALACAIISIAFVTVGLSTA